MQRFLGYILLSFLFSFGVLGQNYYNAKSVAFYQKAIKERDAGNSQAVVKYAQKAIKKDKTFTKAYLLLANVEADRKNFLASEKYLLNALRWGVKNKHLAFDAYLDLLTTQYKYSQALSLIDSANSIKNLNAKDSQLALLSRQVKQSQNLFENPIKVGEVENWDGAHFSEDCYWPFYDESDANLYFTQQECYANCIENLFVAKPVNPSDLESLNVNTNENEGSCCISIDGQYLFFTSCNRKGDGFDFSKELNDSHLGCDIYYSRKTKDGWGHPLVLPLPINTNSWEGNPSVSTDMQFLYFASDREGGFGNKDIWKARLNYEEDGTISAGSVLNIGGKVNSRSDEISPFLSQDQNTLYFASNNKAQGNLGGFDFFYVSLKNDSISTNLGYPINTVNNEYGLCLTRTKELFFAREIDKNKSIYAVKMHSIYSGKSLKSKSSDFIVQGRVMDEYNKPLRAEIEWQIGEKAFGLYSNGLNGDFKFMMADSVRCVIRMKDYVAESFWAFEDVDTTIILTRALAGTIIKSESVYFKTDEFALNDSGIHVLESWIEMLISNPTIKVEVSGYTDEVGTDAYNLELSQKRAKSAYVYFIEQGILPWRISFKGYGKGQETTQTNINRLRRRIELIIAE